MLAVRVSTPGGLDALQFVDLPEPKPAPGQLTLEIKAEVRLKPDPAGGAPRPDVDAALAAPRRRHCRPSRFRSTAA
jgi:hypothetical protein